MRVAYSSFLCTALAVLAWASAAGAQNWPAKPIRWIVPFPPGGANDVTARSLAERLAQTLAQPVVVENRPGAAGTIGTELVAKGPADGYILVSISDTITAAPHLYPKLGFHPIRDFAPVTQLARLPVVVAVHPGLGVSSLAELVAFVKRNPGLGYATAGAGTQQHIAAEWLARLADIQLTHVPYKGGGQAITDLLGGQVQLAVLGAAPLVPHYRSGRLKLLAQTTDARSPLLPDVPTCQEAGFAALSIEQWQGVFFPAGTPREIVARLHAEIVRALAEPKIRERFAQSGLETVGNTPEQFAALVRRDYEKYGRLVSELKIRLD
jgi:tripartite-type tricarboxylate transporter receptor subunit TctC